MIVVSDKSLDSFLHGTFVKIFFRPASVSLSQLERNLNDYEAETPQTGHDINIQAEIIPVGFNTEQHEPGSSYYYDVRETEYGNDYSNPQTASDNQTKRSYIINKKFIVDLQK